MRKYRWVIYVIANIFIAVLIASLYAQVQISIAVIPSSPPSVTPDPSVVQQTGTSCNSIAS